MKTTRHLLWLWMALAGLGSPVVAGATGDGDSAAMLGRILEEGMQRSQVVDLAQHLSDDIGARGSSGCIRRATEYCWSSEVTARTCDRSA
jgi:hypothetical protein